MKVKNQYLKVSQSKFQRIFVLWNQKTIIDILHKEGKSQRVITERGGCSRSAVSKHITCKVYWKEEIG